MPTMPRRNQTIDIGSASDTGMKRAMNQDRVFSQKGETGNLHADALVIVADGMGGHAAGDIAATTAIETFTSALGSADQGNGTLAAMERAALEANRSVFEKAHNENLEGMGTTLTAVALSGADAMIAHIGDSRAYLIKSGKAQQVSTDHSWVEEQVQAGRLKAEDAREHPSRNVLTRALGIDSDARFEIKTVALRGAQSLVLCSDGLYNHVTDAEIAKHTIDQGAQKACDALVKLANERGGTDNISVVIATLPSLASDEDKTIDSAATKRTAGLDVTQGTSGRRSRFWSLIRRLTGRRG
jgi:serine/threonine protein phosphatase PrpC